MIPFRALLTALVLGLFANAGWAADVAELRSLEKAIPYGIELLEAKNYKAFLEAFIMPDDLKNATATRSIDELAQGFGKNKANDLLKALKLAQTLKPTMEATGTMAVYQLPGDGVAGKKEFKFIRLAKHWHIAG